MTRSNTWTMGQEEWSEFLAETNESFLDAFERNVETQAQFVEAWLDTVDESPDMETMTDGLDGYARAYEVWMDAAEESFEKTSDALEGEDVSVEEFRNIWLNTANEAFKEVLSTTAFAAMTGETVDDVLDYQQQMDEAAEETLETLGFATGGDVEEVGERLVELERRQHAVEEKLDRVLDHLES